MGYPGRPTRRWTNVRCHGVQVFGGTFPAPIWRKFMAKATEDLDSLPVRPARRRARARRRHRHGTGVDRRRRASTTHDRRRRRPPRRRRRAADVDDDHRPSRRPPRRPRRSTTTTTAAGRPDADRRESVRGRVGPAGVLTSIVGVVGAAHEAPPLVVADLDLAGRVPGLGRDVEPAHQHDRPRRRARSSRRCRSMRHRCIGDDVTPPSSRGELAVACGYAYALAYRRQPWGAGRDKEAQRWARRSPRLSVRAPQGPLRGRPARDGHRLRRARGPHGRRGRAST